MSVRGKLSTSLRDIHESLGDAGTVELVREMIKDKKIRPEDFSLQEIWHAFERNKDNSVRSYSEAVSSDLFPIITCELISSKIIDAYTAVKTIGDTLTTTVPSKMDVETVAGFTASQGVDEVLEGSAYNDSMIGEKYVTIPHKKFGRIISITEEMIFFDKTGQILARAAGIGQKAAYYREKLIVEGVQDVNSNVFRPSGVATAFYRATASGVRKVNSRAATPFGEDGLEQAMKLFHNMTDEEGDYIEPGLGQLYGLFPFDMWVRVNQMIQSTLVPEGVENAVNVWKGLFIPLTSPFITAQSTSTWYLGDFKNDFWWSEIYPLQTFSSKPGHEDEFNKDIKSKHKVRFYGQIGAITDKSCLKLTA